MSGPLDKALDLAFGETPESCMTCGAPNPAIGLVVLLDPAVQIVDCHACGGSVTDTGVSLTPPFGTEHIKIIRLADDPPGLPRPARPA